MWNIVDPEKYPEAALKCRFGTRGLIYALSVRNSCHDDLAGIAFSCRIRIFERIISSYIACRCSEIGDHPLTG